MSLVTVTVPTQTNGPVNLIGERVTDNFALTPALTTTEDDNAIRLTDRLNLTHIGTGRVITWSMWLNLRDLAHRLEALPINWAAITENNLTIEQRKMVHAAVKEAEQARALTVGEWPEWGADPTTPALSALRVMLDNELSNDRLFTAGIEHASAVAKVDTELGAKADSLFLAAYSHATVSGKAAAYLLAVLHRINPAAADRAVHTLVADWEDGEVLGEMVAEWRDELHKGHPLTLHGFADVTLPGEHPGAGGGGRRRPVYTFGPGEPGPSGEGIFYPFIERDGVAITENGSPVTTATGGSGGGGGARAFHEAWEEAGRDQLIRAQHERDKAYRDRAEILAVLARLFPAYLVHDADPNAPEWAVLFITTEVGQLSWHIAPADTPLFHPDLHLSAADPWAPKWDGHTDTEKSARLRNLADWVSDRDLAAEIRSLAGVYAEKQERRQ
ncbi:hypothetical protein [Nocardia salmonicida]|uniref:hypothetical protein n=1 Tax=Nocardia salmonicida TaxID=53431 RepID=UPI00362F3974